ncbi:hypothetical protein HTZ77_29050 [Nonomuraea sp. SMC257]|uniref:Uncharacterized protein n=1 Tax=Nonomuraea montanisoli TaxID=2741721 RepID=A0A7Y6M548_9ACTN|nr:hypothetical protein [Nonomuraea montanisoli]NUW35448.1 hypothetical protein [Nonomuraea montanisoli]
MERTFIRKACAVLLGSLSLAATLVVSANAAGAQTTTTTQQTITAAGPRCPMGWYWSDRWDRCVRRR